MLKSLSQSIKTKWKRALSGLLAVVTVAGMLPATAFAAGGTPATSSATTPVYAPTGDFEVNIAGATGWNSGSQPLTVYSTESGKTQITAIPASDGAAPIPFALLEDSGGERVKVGLAVDGGGNVTGWEGGKIEKTGWADKKDIFINLPDVLPGIAYNRDGGRQFSSRLSRYEYVVPGSYALAEQLALLQREAMTDGDTLVVCQSGQTVSVSRAKGGSDQLYQYALDGAVYPKYEDWTEYDTPDDTLAALSYELPRIIDRAYSVIPYTTLTELCARSIKKAPVKVSSASPTGGTGGLNPGSPGGQKPTTSNVDWSTDPERTFLRFTLIEFPEGVVKDIGNNDYNTWHVVGTPLNVVWGKGTYENWTAEQCRSRITWFNSSAMQYNGKGSNAAQMMAGGTGGVYAYDATSGYNQRWVTTADEFQKESGITDQQKEQMFHCNSSKWSSSWIDGDYTSMWGTDPQPVTPGNLYKVYKPNDAFLYLLGRLSENSSGAGWSKDDAIAKWSEYVHDASGNLRTKYRVIIETGGVFVDPDGLRRAYTLREMMAYSLYNSENGSKGDLLYDQSSTIRNMAQWMRQSKGQFLEYPLNGDGTPTGEELCSTNGYTEADSFVDSITKAAKIRDTIFTERRSYGLHILSPFNFERPEPTGTSLEVTKKADGSMPAGKTWSFTVTYTAGSPSNFTARKNNVDCTNQVTSTGSGLKFSLKADETIRIVFDADASFRFEVREDDSSQLTAITGTGGTADMATKKFTSSGSESKVTFTNGTTITEKKPVYLKLKKIAAADKKPLSAAEFSVYADSSCTGAPLAVMTTGSDGTASTSVPNIVEDGGSVTLYVKETRAPAGCTPLALSLIHI